MCPDSVHGSDIKEFASALGFGNPDTLIDAISDVFRHLFLQLAKRDTWFADFY